MNDSLPLMLKAAIALFAVALAGGLWSFLRAFVRRAQDGLPWPQGSHFPWWALLALGGAFTCLEAQIYQSTGHFLGAGVVGAVLLAIGAISGRRMRWRIFHLFDATDQDYRERPWGVERAPDPLGPEADPFPYEIAPETSRSNGLARLGGAAFCAVAAYGVLAWGRSYPGEMGFGGVLFAGLFFVFALGAVVLAVSGLIAWCSYLLRRPAGDRSFAPIDWSWARVGSDGARALAMLLGGMALTQLPGPLSLAGIIGIPLGLVGLWLCVRGVIRRVTERLAS